MFEIRQITIEGNIEFTYTNHKGDTARRSVLVDKVVYGTSDYHRQPQMLLIAHCEDADEVRVFAIKDMVDVMGSFISSDPFPIP